MDEKHEPVANGTYLLFWVVLIVLTLTNVGLSRLELGVWNIWIALALATAQAGVVLGIFMHLKQETAIFRLGLFILLLFVAVAIGLTFSDVPFR